MQIIRQNTSYALRALLHMADAVDQTSFTAEELADVAGTTTDFMQKIMQSLRQAGIVASRRGPTGGFRLGRPSDQIALLDITAAVQGQLAISRCIMGLDLCERSSTCPLRSTWTQVQHLIEQSLTNTTLADVLGASADAEPGAAPRSRT